VTEIEAIEILQSGTAILETALLPCGFSRGPFAGNIGRVGIPAFPGNRSTPLSIWRTILCDTDKTFYTGVTLILSDMSTVQPS
jgi:hypothetical protein